MRMVVSVFILAIVFRGMGIGCLRPRTFQMQVWIVCGDTGPMRAQD